MSIEDLAYDVAAVRAHFPALAEGAAHFDGPGGSQVPHAVGEAVAQTLCSAIANRGRLTRAEQRADELVVAARGAVADLLGGQPSGVIFGRSMTQLTYDLSRTLAKTWKPGDEIVVTTLDHDANIRPWVQAAEAVGAVVRWAQFDPQTAVLATEAVTDLLGERTRLVAVTGASNLTGSRPDVAAITSAARTVGALSYIDGVHLTAHAPIELAELGADFYACSPYKFLGPHLGVVHADPALLEQLWPDKLLPATNDVPERFELGTLPYELLAGVTAAVDFLAGLTPSPSEHADRRARLVASMQVLEAHELKLRDRIEDTLQQLPGVRLYGERARMHTPTVLFDVAKMTGADVAAHLAGQGVNAPAGSFYAVECSRQLGLGDAGAVRVGVGPYTDEDDVHRLLDAITDLAG